MKITNIENFIVDAGWRPWGFVKVETDEGIYGWGEAYSTGPDLSVEPIADYILSLIHI